MDSLGKIEIGLGNCVIKREIRKKRLHQLETKLKKEENKK
jgi:hypothetical protein